jgi:hypothetical protein
MPSNSKDTSLAELLLGAINEEKTCRFQTVLSALSDEEQVALGAALRSNLPTSKIVRILDGGGHKVNRIFLAEKRKCYTESEKCLCRTQTK